MANERMVDEVRVVRERIVKKPIIPRENYQTTLPGIEQDVGEGGVRFDWDWDFLAGGGAVKMSGGGDEY